MLEVSNMYPLPRTVLINPVWARNVFSFLRRRNIATSRACSAGRAPSSQQAFINMLGETGMLAEDASVCISRNSVGDSEVVHRRRQGLDRIVRSCCRRACIAGGVGVTCRQGKRVGRIFRIGRWREGSSPGDVVGAGHYRKRPIGNRDVGRTGEGGNRL